MIAAPARRNRNRTGPRAKTLARRFTRAERAARLQSPVEAPPDVERPRTRGDCLPGGCNEQRPCPFVSCKHHLLLDVNPDIGTLKLNFATDDVEGMKETCALDVADRGGMVLEEVGALVNLTRERVRQVEQDALVTLRRRARAKGIE